MKKGLIGIIIIIILIAAGIFLFNNSRNKNTSNDDTFNIVGDSEQKIPLGHEEIVKEETKIQVFWEYDNGWSSQGNPPKCPDPLILKSPVDVSLATSILYPGQIRGGSYNPHGGFRFDNSKKEDIIVRAPLDGYIRQGSRYLQDGEVQYLFDFINSCGIWYRFDHLYKLSPKLAAIAETFPEPVEDDSRTTGVQNAEVVEGEIIGEQVGVEGNVFLDFGVYDLRQKNDASKDPSWNPDYSISQASYAICWLDLLSSKDSTIVKQLPGADSTNGKKSDYC